MFNNHLLVVASDVNAWPNVRVRALLLHCLEIEGQRLFYSLPNQGESLEAAVDAL